MASAATSLNLCPGISLAHAKFGHSGFQQGMNSGALTVGPAHLIMALALPHWRADSGCSVAQR